MKQGSYLRTGLGTLFVLSLFLAGLINLESTPPLWWDEGWNLTIARNWVEQGYYGRLLDGKPYPISPSNGFPVIAPIALSFRLLDVGVWQGRIIGVFFTIGALGVIYHLASQLYNRSVAIATLIVLLLMSCPRDLHPIIMGRQALGEMPAMFYLLGGYAFLLLALRRSIWFTALAVLLWAAALITKLQVLPFWTISLLTPLSVALSLKSWKLVGILTIGLFGSLITSQLLLKFLQLLTNAQTLPYTLITMLYNVSVWVPLRPHLRLLVVILTLAFALPMLLGLYYASSQLMRNGIKFALETPQKVVHLVLLALVGSWAAWHLFLSPGWLRYLFPATFIGSIFAAAFLHHLTDGFNLLSTIKHGGYALRRLHFNRENAGPLLVTLLIAWTFSLSTLELYRSFVVDADKSALLVADFINKQTPSNTLIETYDSELFFLLNRRYHYPPDQIHVELNRRTFLGQNVAIDYEPLAANPDYLVVGPHSKLWGLYDPVLTTEELRLFRSYSRYDVYERVR